jgi:type VI secretion system secreted protein VgrG
MPIAITLTTPLPPADLRFEALTHSAGLSTLEETRLQLLSEKADLVPEQLLGHPVDVAIELRDGAKRHFHGYVARFAFGRHQGRYYGYQAEVVPWLWFLTRRSDCRIFQDMDVQEIVEKVFEKHAAIASYEFKLTRLYRKRGYCVQYRETDFNFVARLLEDEGIYWYFEHSEGQHKLILVDMASAHAAVPGFESLPFYANTGQLSPDVDFVTNWNFSRGVASGGVAMTSYNFEYPKSALKVAQQVQRQYELSSYEMFDFQGDYQEVSDGQQLAENRIDELQARFEQVSATTNAHGLATGHLFSLTRHPRGDQNAEFLVLQTQIRASMTGSEAGGGSDGEYSCTFNALRSSQQFRPARRTPKPFVQGPQSAVVVGASGDEIFTDAQGRVKVQFHWDRYGQKNEHSSCWMRVSHPWAGKSFGMIHIPRVGQEVIVDFFEGDPDQPIITGRVYNADQTPPWQLPGAATQSGILTRSTKGGAYGNANMLRFEDKKGSEMLELHAEKDMSTVVENDQASSIGRDRTEQIMRDRRVTVDHKDTLIVNKAGRFVTVAAGGEEVNLTGGRKYNVKGGLDQNTILNGRITKITGTESLGITGDVTRIVNGKTTEIYNGGLKVGVTGDIVLSATGKINQTAGGAVEYVGPSFKWTTPGNLEYFGNQFNRTVNQANDVFLGPNTGTYMGAVANTLVAGVRETFVGLKNSLELSLATTCTIGASINTSISAALNAGLSATIEMMAGPELVMGPLGLEQKSIDVAQSALKVITGGGGAGGGGGGGGAAAAAAVGAGVGLSVGAAIGNAMAAYEDIAKFLEDVKNAPNYGEARSALDGPTLTSMVATIFSAGANVYEDAHPEQSKESMEKKQAEMKKQAEQQAAADQAAAQKAMDAAANPPAPGGGQGGGH